MYFRKTEGRTLNMLKRKITDKLKAWKANKTHQALLILGARQVGKTTAVREFARVEYEELAEVNFYQNKIAIETLSAATDAEDVLLRLSVLTGKNIESKKTLLFLDEIQECADMLTWVKFLLERDNLDVILSGSLLGIDAFVHIRSLPVGFLQKITMYPLDFEEYCWARGITDNVWRAAVEALRAHRPVPDFIHERLTALFREYLMVGGMPDTVQAFVTDGQIVRARDIQRGIIDLYQDDIVKYVGDPVEARQIKMVYEAIPGQLNAPSKRFKYARLGKNLRFANLETAFDWLTSAGIAIEATRVGGTEFPLGLSEDRASFKFFMNDVGLLTSRLMGDVDLEIINGRAGINYGSIFEAYVAQELLSSGFVPHYYFSKKKGEVDFVIENARTGETCAIEVKSGKDYRRHSALNALLADGDQRAVVLYDGNLELSDGRLYMPVYAAGQLGGVLCAS